jgi:hypothetical protein
LITSIGSGCKFEISFQIILTLAKIIFMLLIEFLQ